MAHKNKREKEQDDRKGMGNGQMNTATGETNNGGQRENPNKGEANRDKSDARGNRQRG